MNALKLEVEVFLFQVGFQKDEDVKPDSHTVDIQPLRSEDKNQQEEEEEEEDAVERVLNPAPVTVSTQSSIMYVEVMVTSLITLQPRNLKSWTWWCHLV